MSIESDNIFQKISEMDVLINSLLTDFNNLHEILGQNLVYAEKSNDFSLVTSIIRMKIRSIVSTLESACFSMRYVAYEICNLKKIPIPSKYSELFIKNNKFEVKDKIKLSLKFLGFSTSGIENIDVHSNEWQIVCEVLETRHRITHPKNVMDLNVSEKDLANVNITLFWFSKQLMLISKQDVDKISMKISDEDINKIKKRFRDKYE